MYTPYFRAAEILSELSGADDRVLDPANPYLGSKTQASFGSLGYPHLLALIGTAHKAERHAWYDKWYVHRFLRPEAFGGRVHSRMSGRVDAERYPID